MGGIVVISSMEESVANSSTSFTIDKKEIEEAWPEHNMENLMKRGTEAYILVSFLRLPIIVPFMKSSCANTSIYQIGCYLTKPPFRC
jgi:hypothetical protein